MTDARDELFSDEPVVAQAELADQDTPSVSHEVIASYIADAVRSVPGIEDLHASAWKGLSSRVRETHSGGVLLKESPTGTVDAEIHVRVGWGSIIPDVARQVEDAVRERVMALLSLDIGTVTLFVDEITDPAEDGSSRED